MLRQAKRAWFIWNSGREFDRYSWFLLVCPVNRLNSPLVEHLDDLFNIGTSLLIFLILHGASSGMYHVDLHFLKTIQLFQHPLVRGGIFVTAIAEEKRGKNYLLIRIAGKSFGLIAQCFQTAGSRTGHAGVQAAQNCKFLHRSYSAAKTSGYRISAMTR